MCVVYWLFSSLLSQPQQLLSAPGLLTVCSWGEAPALEPGAVPALFEEGFSTVPGKCWEIFPVKQFWFLALDQRHLARWPVQGWMWCLLLLHPSCRTGHGKEVHPMGALEHTVFRAVTGAFSREGCSSVSCAPPAAAAARGGSGMVVES